MLNKANEYRQSLEITSALIADEYKDTMLFTIHGRNLWQLDRYTDALPWFEKALELSPDDESAHTGMSDCYDALGDKQSALRHATTACEIDPTDAINYQRRGKLLLRLGKLADARQAFQTALELGSNCDDIAMRCLGETEQADGNPDVALEWYKRALEIDPKYEWNAYLAAWLLHDMGRSDEAADILRKACDDHTRIDPNILLLLSRIESQLEQHDAATALLNAVQNRDPDNPSVQAALAHHFHLTEDSAKKHEHMAILEKLSPELATELREKWDSEQGTPNS